MHRVQNAVATVVVTQPAPLSTSFSLCVVLTATLFLSVFLAGSSLLSGDSTNYQKFFKKPFLSEISQSFVTCKEELRLIECSSQFYPEKGSLNVFRKVVHHRNFSHL